MAKEKQENQNDDRLSGKSRREMALAKKQAEQIKRLRLGAFVVLGLIALIIIVGLVVEFLVIPNQAVAEVKGESISLREWQRVVRFQRAQLINSLEEQYDQLLDEEAEDQALAADDALRFVQQFSGQQINALTFGYETLGEIVLDQMVDDIIVRQAAAARGIAISEAEVDEAIGEQYSFYDGDSPTPFPTATQGPEPTPSITPVVFGEAQPTTEPLPTVTPGPTNTPFPTPTPVSQESFEEQFNEDMDAISSTGGDPGVFRLIVENALYREKLAEALFEEGERPTIVPHTSAYFLIFGDEQSANEQLAIINDSSYLEVWNTVRSIPPGTGLDTLAQATERLYWTDEQYGTSFPAEVTVTLRDLPVGEHSDVIAGTNMQTGEPAFYIVSVSGREDRELDEFTIQRQQQEVLSDFLNAERAANATVYENWRGRVPRQPILPARFTEVLPTLTPQPVPTLPVPAPAPAESEEEGGE